jgi:hypothetical protein
MPTILKSNSNGVKKLTIILLCALAISGCIFKGLPKKTTTVAFPPRPAEQQGASDINLGAANGAVKLMPAEAGGSTYTNKTFGFEVWYPSTMHKAEESTSDTNPVTILSNDPSVSNLKMTIASEHNPATAFDVLPGKSTVLNDTRMKRVPVDTKDPLQTNAYIFEKNGVRVTVSLSPGNSPERFMFPDIIQSFKFAK